MASLRSEPHRSSAIVRVPIVMVVAASLLVGRLITGGSRFDTVWAEDGRIFLLEGQEAGWWSLTQVYAGYLHTVPRVIALLGSLLPLETFAAASMAAAIACVAALCAFVSECVTRVTGSTAWGLVAGIGQSLAAAAGFEAIANLANLQWWLIAAAFCALSLDRHEVRGAIGWCAIAVTLSASLTTPLIAVLLLVPLARLRPILTAPVVAALIGLAIQAAAMGLFPRSSLATVRDPQFGRELVTDWLAGVTGPVRGPGIIAILVGLLVSVGLVAMYFQAEAGRPRRTAGMAFGIAALLFLVTEASSGSSQRYQLCAGLLVIIGFSLLAPCVRNPWAPRVGLIAATAIAVASFPVGEWRTSGKPWSESTAEACASASLGDGVMVETGPITWQHRQFVLECERPS